MDPLVSTRSKRTIETVTFTHYTCYKDFSLAGKTYRHGSSDLRGVIDIEYLGKGSIMSL